MDQRIDIVKLLSDFKCLFGDVPTQTNVLKHDINVNGAHPIKQHAYRVNSMKRSVMCQEVEYFAGKWFSQVQLQSLEFSMPTCSQIRWHIQILHRLS